MGLSLIGVLSLSFSAIIFIPHLRKVVDAVEAVPCFWANGIEGDLNEIER
jgi:hypothetical protein